MLLLVSTSLCWLMPPCSRLDPTLCQWLIWRRIHWRWWAVEGARRRLGRWATCWRAAPLPPALLSQAVLRHQEHGQATVLLRLTLVFWAWGCPYAALLRWLVQSAAAHAADEAASASAAVFVPACCSVPEPQSALAAAAPAAEVQRLLQQAQQLPRQRNTVPVQPPQARRAWTPPPARQQSLHSA